VNTTVTTY